MLPRHEHAFRYPPIPNLPRFGILAVTLFTLAIGLVMLLAPMKERWLGITIGVLMVALALLLPSYVLFANRRRLVVDAQGIRLEGSLGRTMIPWQEVTALECSEVRGRVYQNVWYVAYRVWSKRRKIAFYKQLAGCEELAALVSDAAGMDWS